MSLLEKKLLEKSVIDDAIYRKANVIFRKYGGTFPLNLVRMNAIGEDDLLEFIQTNFSISLVTQERLENISISIMNLVPAELAKRFRLIPFGVTQTEVRVAMSDPTEDKIITEIAFITGRSVQAFTAAESVISWALLKYYGVITESGSELESITAPDIPAAGTEAEEIPIPLVTRKKEKQVFPSSSAAAEETNDGEADTKSGGGEVITEMGGWESPFELSRTSTIDIEIPAGQALKESSQRHKRKTPTKLALPAPDAPGEPPVEKAEEHQEQKEPPGEKFPVILHDEIMEAAPKTEPEKEAKEENQAHDAVQDRDSSVSIAPTHIIGSTSTVAETIGRKESKIPVRKRVPTPAQAPPQIKKTTLPPPPTTKGAPTKTIDRSRVDRWSAFISTLTDTEKIIERTLSFLDTVFGPTVFLWKKKDVLEPYRFSLSIPKSTYGKLKKIVVQPTGFTEIWKCLEKGNFSLIKVSARKEYKSIVDINVDASWVDETLIVIIPVVIGKVKAGVLISVPTREWEDTPELQEIFSVIANTISKVFEKIIMERKKGSHGNPGP